MSGNHDLLDQSVEKRLSRLSDYTMTLTNQLVKCNKMTSPKARAKFNNSEQHVRAKSKSNEKDGQNVRQFLNNVVKKKKVIKKSKSRCPEIDEHTMLKPMSISNKVTSPTAEQENEKILQKIKSEIYSIDGEISELQMNLQKKIDGRNFPIFENLTTS